jgi:hypothetical protein
MPAFFESPQAASEDPERTVAQLHERIGELSVEVDWLKECKQLGLLGSGAN